MARQTATAETVRDLMAENTGEAWFALLTVEATGYPTAYLVCNNEDVVSRGQTYMASYFDLPPPDQYEDQLPTSKLKVQNVDRRIVETVREITGKIYCTLEIIAASHPDDVEEGPYKFTAKTADYDVNFVTLDLGYEDILSEDALYGAYTPSDFPNVF